MTTKVITGVALALATLLVSPAFAQTRGPVNQYGAHYDAYAEEYGPSEETIRHQAQPEAHPNWDVYNTNGRYVGRDPDPNVREMIGRDHDEQFGNGF